MVIGELLNFLLQFIARSEEIDSKVVYKWDRTLSAEQRGVLVSKRFTAEQLQL